MKPSSQNTVLLFGSFDGIHPGHEHIIRYARDYGENLILVVARDEVIKNTKGRMPVYPIHKRIQSLQKKFPEIKVIVGDKTEGAWSAIINFCPDIIVVGYDQDELSRALTLIPAEHNFDIITAPAFHPERYKSSLLRK